MKDKIVKDKITCEVCGLEVESVDELTEYLGLLVDDGYLTCDECTEKLESSIKDIIKSIRDARFRNPTELRSGNILHEIRRLDIERLDDTV